MPALTDKITFAADGHWAFPAGTVWIIHFDLDLVRGDPTSARRLETRFLVKTAGGVYGASYRWNAEQTEANLVPEEGANEEISINDAGTVRLQTWRYPSRSECLQCHTAAGGHALGFNTAQLNGLQPYLAGPANQITTLAEAGYFTATSLPPPATLRALAPADASSVSLEHRVRSYLSANCVQCHQPGGAALGSIDARIETPTVAAGLLGTMLVNPGGDAANRVIAPADVAHSMLLTRVGLRGSGQMPPLASNEVDSTNLALLRAWVNALGPPSILTQPASRIVAAGASAAYTVNVASALEAVTFQWRRNGVPILGAVASTLVLTNVGSPAVAGYDVVVSNQLGSVTSNLATLGLASIPAGFDVPGYLARYPDVAAVYQYDHYAAWAYYRDQGVYQGEVFDEYFRVEEYLALYPELFALFGANLGGALLHWLNEGRIEGRLGRVPPEFSAPGYFERNPDVAAAVGFNPVLAWQHFWAYGIYEGRAFDDEFRVFEYLALNPDLQTAFLGDWRGATLHWLRYGRTEGRLGRVPLIFNSAAYLNRYPEVGVAWGTNPTTVWQHFWYFGLFEGRVFDEEFRVDEYLALNADLQAAFGTDRRAAFMHWVRYGRAEGRPGRNF